jgi:hypothetical protein|tara:strand:- start:3913 stop:4248 length:336 start_codon:yes stop_codon:yes gene_type:complete
LHTVQPNDPAWEGRYEDLIDASGAIIRIKPPAGVDPTVVDAVKASFVTRGALAVKVLPPEPGGAVVVKGNAKKPSRKPPRQLVHELVDAARSRNRSNLHSLVEEVMNEEGL